jgi:hypothetical protein
VVRVPAEDGSSGRWCCIDHAHQGQPPRSTERWCVLLVQVESRYRRRPSSVRFYIHPAGVCISILWGQYPNIHLLWILLCCSCSGCLRSELRFCVRFRLVLMVRTIGVYGCVVCSLNFYRRYLGPDFQIAWFTTIVPCTQAMLASKMEIYYIYSMLISSYVL